MALRSLTVTSDGPVFTLTHGTVSGGPFEDNERLNGVTSGASARIISSPGSNQLTILLDGITSFESGEIIRQISGSRNGAAALLSTSPDPGSVSASIEDQNVYVTERGKVLGADLVIGDKVDLMASDDCLYRIVSIP